MRHFQNTDNKEYNIMGIFKRILGSKPAGTVNYDKQSFVEAAEMAAAVAVTPNQFNQLLAAGVIRNDQEIANFDATEA